MCDAMRCEGDERKESQYFACLSSARLKSADLMIEAIALLLAEHRIRIAQIADRSEAAGFSALSRHRIWQRFGGPFLLSGRDDGGAQQKRRQREQRSQRRRRRRHCRRRRSILPLQFAAHFGLVVSAGRQLQQFALSIVRKSKFAAHTRAHSLACVLQTTRKKTFCFSVYRFHAGQSDFKRATAKMQAARNFSPTKSRHAHSPPQPPTLLTN